MRRVLILLLLALVLPARQQSLRAIRGRYFARYPFDRWAAEPEAAGIKWSARILPARLTVHQRLSTRIQIQLDVKEVAKRRGRGELVTLVQIQDAAGKQWRIHNAFDLTRIPHDAKTYPLLYSQEVFLTPGDYKFSMATCDSDSPDHSFTVRPLHVPEIRNDAFPHADRDLPAVEFVRPLEAPDNWFQPNIRGRLRIPLETSRPIHFDILLNMTPSDRAAGSLRAFRRNMSVLVPSLKILAGVELTNGSIDIALLDLTRQKVFEQKAAHGLDWARLRAPLADTQPGVIDAQSLAAKSQMLRFFRSQVVEKANAPGDGLHIVIVLSAPAFFDRQLHLDPVTLERDPNRRIFYLRYRPLPPRPNPDAIGLPPDDLEGALKALDARVLTAMTPEDFRKALAAILKDIRR
jgi:hypothetical protein